MADEPPPGPLFLAASYLVLIVIGAALAVIGAFLVPAGPRPGGVLLPLGVLVALVGNPAVAVLGARLTGTRLGAGVPILVWLLTLWVLNSRPEGDRVPALDAKGLTFLLGGVLAGGVAVLLVRTERGVTSLGFNLLTGVRRPVPDDSAGIGPPDQ